MVKGEIELRRTDSLCQTPADLLLEYVNANDVHRITTLINDNRQLLSNVYDYPHYKSILQISCSKESVHPSVVETLLDLGADLFFSQECDDHKQALHFAAQSTNPRILNVVIRRLKQLPNGSIDAVDANRNTALHVLIKDGDKESPYFKTCVEILIENGIDVNKSDNKNQTGILLAARQGYNDVVKLLAKQPNIDIDSHKLRGKTAREWIKEKNLILDVLPTENILNNNQNPKDILFSYLRQNNEEEFANIQNIDRFVNDDDGASTLLQYACQNGQTEAVRCLLDNGADPNYTTMINRKSAIEIISELGYYEIFGLLLEHKKVQIPQNVICNLLKYMDQEQMWKVDYRKCFDLLRSKFPLINVNEFDTNKNTPLHYAVVYSEAETALELLEMGASLATKNSFGVAPIHDINPKLLEDHLDNCIEIESNKDGDVRENCIVSFKYRTLIPSPDSVKYTDKTDLERSPLREIKELVVETEVVSYISQSSELKHLLLHPVITSFLFMKWHRMRMFFYTNLAFYVTFCFTLVLYILLHYSPREGEETAPENAFSNFLLVILLITYVLLVFREVFQIIVSPKTYFFSFENWVEVCLIVVTFSIFLGSGSHSEDARKQLSSIAVLLSTFELVMLAGQHPLICTNVVMLRTVSLNFFKFLLWFSLLILAFAFSFYVLFNKNSKGQAQNVTADSDGDGEVEFFSDPGMSIIKTIVMLTGEFDAGSINFTTFRLTSSLIFLAFVFMIAIILFNLLNGLAVNDTQIIKNHAELVGLISRTEHIRYTENMILGNVLPTSIFKLASSICCCLPIKNELYIAVPQTFAKQVCLFPHFLQNYTLQFYPIKYGEVILDKSGSGSGCYGCSKIYLDGKTIRRTINKLHDRKAPKEESLETRFIKLQNNLNEKILVLSEKLDKILKNFDK